MLTLQQLKDMEPDTIFATGETTDGYDAVNMYGKGQELRWVATRGGIHDWAIYVAPKDWTEEMVKSNGDKVHNRESVKKLVPCDDEALGMYRD
jgi:hypothetical protein